MSVPIPRYKDGLVPTDIRDVIASAQPMSGHPIQCVLTKEEARLTYAVLWQALSFADSKAYLINLLAQAEKQSPELRLQADEVGRLSNVMASVIRKFGFCPPTHGGVPETLIEADARTVTDE